MKSTVFWDITPSSPLEVNRRFGGTYRLHLQGRRMNQARNEHKAGSSQCSACCLLYAGFFLVLFFDTSHKAVILNSCHLPKDIEEKHDEVQKNGYFCGFVSNALLQINLGFSCTARCIGNGGVCVLL
jgi:hypothetical protein